MKYLYIASAVVQLICAVIALLVMSNVYAAAGWFAASCGYFTLFGKEMEKED